MGARGSGRGFGSPRRRGLGLSLACVHCASLFLFAGKSESGPLAGGDWLSRSSGEKIHEEMITESDSYTSVDLGKYYAILPQVPVWSKEDYLKQTNAKPVPLGFKYNSGTNDKWLGVEELRQMIKNHLDPAFEA